MKARSVRRAAVIAGLMMLVLSSAGHAACGPGTEACEPAIEEARAKLERLFSSAYVTPHALVSLEKRDGRSLETRGRRMYEMRFVAVLNYPGDRLRCRKHLCPSCTTIWWKSTPPRRRQRSRAGFSSSRGRTAGARRARAAPVRSVGWAKPGSSTPSPPWNLHMCRWARSPSRWRAPASLGPPYGVCRYSSPSMIRMSRTAPSPSARSASA